MQQYHLLFKSVPVYSFIRCVLLTTICVVIFGVWFSVSAQDTNATLRVLVISEDDGTPVIGATVLLTIPDADTLRAGVTNVDGYAEFSGLPPRTLQVQVSYIGFETHRNILSLQSGQTLIYRPELAIATEMLGEVTVRATAGAVRREAGRQTITAEQINRIPSPGPGGDLTSYLQTLPGVVTSGDRGGELFIRGGTPAQNLILVDNIPVIKPFHISNLFSAFPQETISSAELYAGGFGAEYSGATSAVLDVNLRQGNMRRLEGQAAVSPYMVSMQFEGPVKRDEQSLLFVGRTSMLEQTAPSLIGREVPLTFYDMTARYSINWTEMVCNITGMHTYDRGRINPQRNVELTWGNTALGARCMGFGEEIDHAFDISFGYSNYHSSESGFDDTVRSSGIRLGFIRVDNGWELLGLPIDYGARLDFVQFKARLDEPFAERSGSGARFTHLDSSLDQITSTFSGYTTLIWQPSSLLTLKPGITSQVSLNTISPTLEPRLRMTWRPDGSDRQEFSLATGRYMQVMDAISDERDAGTVFYVYKPVNRDDPLPESLHAILGYQRQFGNYLEISIEGYGKRHRNIPVAQWTREPGNTISTALAKGTTMGADIQVEFNRQPFYVVVGYGLSKTTYNVSSNDLVAWLDTDRFTYNPSHDRRHQLNLISSFEFAGFTASAIWQYSSGNPFTRILAFDLALNRLPDQYPLLNQGRAMTLYSEPFDGRFPSFHRLDVSLSRPFRITRGFTIETEIGAVNAYNIQNIFYFDVNTMQQVDELPFLPYLSVITRFR